MEDFFRAIEENYGWLEMLTPGEYANRFPPLGRIYLPAASYSEMMEWARGTLEIIQESNAGNPLRRGLMPLLTCDVWEHGYYIDYQNRRSDYLNAFWELINWEIIERRYSDARNYN
jgi:superoxide dismutase